MSPQLASRWKSACSLVLLLAVLLANLDIQTAQADDDPTLKGLAIKDHNFVNGASFDPNVSTYVVTVPAETDTVTVSATPNDPSATIIINGDTTLSPVGEVYEKDVPAYEGDSFVVVKVISADVSTHIRLYGIDIRRPARAASPGENPSTLSSLSMSSGTLNNFVSDSYITNLTDTISASDEQPYRIIPTPTQNQFQISVSVNGAEVDWDMNSFDLIQGVDNYIHAVVSSTDDPAQSLSYAILANAYPPLSIAGVPAPKVTVGSTYSFTPTVTPTDGSLVFSISPDKPTWANFNTSTGALVGSPTSEDRGTFPGIIISVSDGYQSASLSAFSIQVLDTQTITFDSALPPDPIVGGTPYVPKAHGGGSANPVVFSIAPSASAVCSYSADSGEVSFHKADECVIYANQAGNDDYEAAPQISQSITVGKGNQTIVFDSAAPKNPVCGETTYTPLAHGGPSTEPVVLSIALSASPVCSLSPITGVVSFQRSGQCVILADQAGDANYEAASEIQQSFMVTAPEDWVATLKNIEFSAGYLDQAFDPNHTDYTMTLSREISSLQITLFTNQPSSPTLSINGIAVPSDQAQTIDLNLSKTTIAILATAKVTSVHKTYTIAVNQPPDLAPLRVISNHIDEVCVGAPYLYSLVARSDYHDTIKFEVTIGPNDRPLPGWLSYQDNKDGTLTFFGRPTMPDLASPQTNVKVVATDEHGNTANQIFILTVYPPYRVYLPLTIQ